MVGIPAKRLFSGQKMAAVGEFDVRRATKVPDFRGAALNRRLPDIKVPYLLRKPNRRHAADPSDGRTSCRAPGGRGAASFFLNFLWRNRLRARAGELESAKSAEFSQNS
jgi:hypothetical protein